LDTLLSVEQAAERLGTSVRFVRRLIAERRIAYVKVAGMCVSTRPMWRRSSPPVGLRSDHRR
jgi:excisionase family DNA binding protein